MIILDITGDLLDGLDAGTECASCGNPGQRCTQCSTPFCMDCYRRYEWQAESVLCWVCQNQADRAWLRTMDVPGGPRREPRTPVRHQLYTLGYTGWKPAALQALVAERGAVLVDIRYRAWSRAPQWRPDGFRALVGGAYVGMSALGNPNYKEGWPLSLTRPEAALPELRTILQERPAILLCGCQDVHSCHRRVAAFWLADRFGCAVTHLERDGAHWSEVSDARR
jgi:hypothetical protein